MSDKTNVGYIGLGNIGKPSARHLIGDAYRVHVFDAFPQAMTELVEAGAIGCQTAAEVASACAHIGICVRDGDQVESLLYGNEGILEHAGPGTIVAIHSTVSRDEILKWVADGEAKGVKLIDAGISGGARGAEAGTLVYMVGGDEETVERARPVFMTSADNVIHAGEPGAGMVLKLCNNLATYLQFQAMSEAARLAASCGIHVDLLREVGKTNGVFTEQMHAFVSGRSAMAAACSAEEMHALFGPFGKLGEKDLECALACAAQAGVDLPFTAALKRHVYDMFTNEY